MARRSYETLARELAKEKGGISLDVEIDDGRDFAVEIWGYPAHQSYDGGTHTSIPSMTGFDLKSPAQVWKRVYEELQSYEPCSENCNCYTEE